VYKTWSHGTWLRRRLRLPLTLSDTTILTPLKSAISCKAVRSSILGKFMDMGAPLNTGKDCAFAAQATKQHR
jgi:hypothetical protein